MSDEPIKLAEGITSAPRGRAKVLGHLCEHEGCLMHAGFGFARLRQDPHVSSIAPTANGIYSFTKLLRRARIVEVHNPVDQRSIEAFHLVVELHPLDADRLCIGN